VKDKIELTEEMVNTLENPPKANDAFKAAAKKYKGEDIKMADVFDLPVIGISEWSEFHTATFCYFNDGQRDLEGSCHMDAAAHAINQHDKLAQQVAELRAVIIEANDYLNFNNLTSIGHGSGLHESFKYALREGE